MFSKILAVEYSLPKNFLTVDEIERRILETSEIALPVKTVSRLTGVNRIFLKDDSVNASDLAADAGRKALRSASVKEKDIDLLIFASASQDLIEPATAHIVAHKLGISAPVMDVKNACNSFLNGVQVADLFIKSGQHKKVLVVSGETPSVSIRWNCETKDSFLEAFPGFSMSDSGGAMLLSAVHKEEESSMVKVKMSANSEMWDIGILDTGGSRSPRNPDTTYFNIDGGKLYEAFRTVGCELLFNEIAAGLDWNDYRRVGAHQVSTIYTKMLTEALHIPENKLVEVISEYGNLASNSLPLQMGSLIDSGELQQGDMFAFIGLGGGISTGLGVFRI